MAPTVPVPAQGAPVPVVVLGSTGSIGTQALDVVDANPGVFEVVGLGAGGADPGALAAQAASHGVPLVAVAREDRVAAVRGALAAAGPAVAPTVLGGADAASDLVREACAKWGEGVVVLNGITGSVGLRPTLAALESGATLALANKESLVAGGALVRRALRRPGQVVPVAS